MVRVLVAEDSAVTREYLAYLLGQDTALQVVGLARDGQEALEQAERLKPDVILMDVHMPRMNGYEATRRIMERVPTPIVMVSASLDRDEVAMSFESLKAGAVTLLDKPRGPDHPDQAASARRLVETVKLMAEVKVVRRFPRRERPVTPPSFPPPSDRAIRLIAIAASTGGPQVLAEILAGLPANFALAILIVQHIAPGFTDGLAQWLAQTTRQEVRVPALGEAVRPGVVYLAPEGWQMGITKDGRIRLTKDLIEDGFRPSATYLFHSVAEAYGRSAVGVILTGMGRDGASGLRRLREAGAVTIAQDEATSVVFGMPAEAIRLGAAEYVLPRGQIAAAICSLVPQG
ncbi:MAG TPA: chemotaxis-specific protein-glutamate methyltransferase CheB [Candidatus Methylomirabilis sp.]|jgi:two-component system chemotaxis response regulator CheB|nr:chemotaxis-specific protein-glutamate methyltransferase CheB [Candidatus Methylomirabilis sp.]